MTIQGALRDMLQNHLLQLVGLIAMEPPSSFDSNAIRNETLKVFQSLHPLKEEYIRKNVIRGQYIGYLQEQGVEEKFKNGNLCGFKILHRQLALGRNSILCKNWKKASLSSHRDRHQFQVHPTSSI